MKQPGRPTFIRNWQELEPSDQVKPPVMDEPFGFVSEFSPAVGLTHLRTAHMRLPPGVRAYPPMAMRDEEVFFYVVAGAPDLWANGHLHRLREGDGAALVARTGLAHSIINNTTSDVRLFVCAEAMHYTSRGFHPVDPAANANLEKMGKLWRDPPKTKLGPNDGKPGNMAGRRRGLPDFVANGFEILARKSQTYPESREEHGVDALFGRRARFSRIGVHLEVLKPGRRTSWPHAERDEEEFVFVVSGKVDCWIDGFLHPMEAGDIVAWEAGTGITHVVINNGDDDAVLIVGGEAGRTRNQFWYPFHPRRNKDIGALYWADHPVPRLGPHDGLPDRLRASLPAAARRSAVAANEAARKFGLGGPRQKR